ncbi:hypothetical protein A4H97_28240 [Niastella yeongjuensis]|uniref:Knr4/Smi1-like domain-containing protein n=1 Tax=Niastella yeongjuensis TaxID=354355 RepID=A0A1V9EUS5_9BACT|nr:SMI1/KNR4 family protein [Niastella yeongjuensis]OQP49782.1 hypothetical protein A4H97_28240 [Niastella yeongjuensis]SEP40368.1 SMI1 / KNR4 family (SUKH-1) [Niastella yeongjuensis]
MSLPKEILEIFYKTLSGELPVLEFEEWLYANHQLEAMMTPDDYLDLIAYGYKGQGALPGLHELLRKHVDERELAFRTHVQKKYAQGYRPTLIKTPFDEQLQRIKEKLVTAAQADKNCMAYGAELHEYMLSVPVTEEEAAAFERRYSIQLPADYRAFLLVVGNGGVEFEESYGILGAGPYNGLYPLDYENDKSKDYLKYDCVIDPDMTIEQWELLAQFKNKQGKISPEAYRQEAHKVFGGVLPLGSQGCSYIHALVVKGPYAGRVVNLDYNYIVPPLFAPTATFLDWYEGWLDEVINGTLLKRDAPFYGFP